MAIDNETVKRVAFRSRLKVDDDKIETTKEEFNKILNWIEELNEINTDNVGNFVFDYPFKNLVLILKIIIKCRAHNA